VNRLRRVFVLFNTKHGINETDKIMLQSLNDRCLSSASSILTVQAIITKADAVSPEQAEKIIPMMRRQIFEGAPACLPPIITAALMRPPFGIEETRRSILEACGLGVINVNTGGDG
jgi:GTP-binding protein